LKCATQNQTKFAQTLHSSSAVAEMAAQCCITRIVKKMEWVKATVDTNQKPVWDILLHLISECFQDIAKIWSTFRCR